MLCVIMNTKIMYIELKSDGLRGEGRIARVRTSKSGKTIYYGERKLVPSTGFPLKANFYDEDTHEDFWVSGPRKDGSDSLFAAEVEIDEDAREEYWLKIRNQPNSIQNISYRSPGKTKVEREKIEKGLRRRQMDNGWMSN